MSELLDRIRSAGHWRVTIRPSEFREDRLEFGSLERLVVEKQVQIRGWYFPHISSREPIANGTDWIGQESVSSIGSSYLEVWRFYTSGQFAWVRSFSREGYGEPGSEAILPVYEVVNVVTETYEFAARLALEGIFGEKASVRIVAGGLQGHRLVVGDPRRAGIDASPMTVEEDLKKQAAVEKTDLIANPRTLALGDAVWFLQRMGWRSAPKNIVRDIQEEIFGASVE
jgi:hypothetical protein